MDYDRKELVDWVRGIYQNLDDADRQDALRFFPELRESEDERIRSCIGLALTDVNEQRFKDFGITLKDCLSWLEKQKEIQMPNSTELIEMWHKAKAILKEKDFRGDEWRLAQNAFMDGFARGTCVKSEKQKEQKPAEWSEDDKNMWTHLNGYLNGFSCSEDAIKQMADWFYELPNRFNPQPKQEWSEEDDNKIESIKGLITTGRFADTNTVRTIWKLLDSIHPRPSWKPSEELLDALYIVANLPELEFYGGIKDKIRELYKQLKRIK